MRYAHSTAHDEPSIVRELVSQLDPDPAAIITFYGCDRPGEAVARRLAEAFPRAEVLGCMSAGELSTGYSAQQSVVACSLDRALVVRVATAVADYGELGLERAVTAAVRELEQTFGRLSSLDPTRHVGLIFLDSNHAIEERTHVVLGNHAPLLSFVGGSSGNFGFNKSRIVSGRAATSHGCGLMVLELGRPFHLSKSCHFGPRERAYVATRAEGRLLHELDGRPAAEVYAEHLGITVDQLSYQNLILNPIGLVIDGEPWLRQVWPPIHTNGTIHLGCAVAQGSTLHFMKPRMDLVTSLQRELESVRAALGGTPTGALFFDCVGRRSELEMSGALARYLQLIDFPMAGFNTVGESWIGHMAQTLTALYFR